MFVNPKDCIELFLIHIGDVVGVPDGHVHKAGLCAIEFKGHYLVSADAAQFNGGFPFNHGEAFGFAGVEVVAAGDAGHCCRKTDLSATVEFDGLDEAPTVVGIEFEVVREETFVVEVAEEGVPEVAVETVVEVWDSAFFEVVVSILCEFGEQIGDFDG